MNRYKRPNKRRRVLSYEGWKKLQGAICQAFGEAYMDKPPFGKLSERTKSSDNRQLDADTVSKIWKREEAVYRSSLRRLFRAVGLTLDPSDHITFCEDLNTEIPSTDTRVIAKPRQELGEAVKPSASTLSSNQRVDYTSLREAIAFVANEELLRSKKKCQLNQKAIAVLAEQAEELLRSKKKW